MFTESALRWVIDLILSNWSDIVLLRYRWIIDLKLTRSFTHRNGTLTYFIRNSKSDLNIIDATKSELDCNSLRFICVQDVAFFQFLQANKPKPPKKYRAHFHLQKNFGRKFLPFDNLAGMRYTCSRTLNLQLLFASVLGTFMCIQTPLTFYTFLSGNIWLLLSITCKALWLQSNSRVIAEMIE